MIITLLCSCSFDNQEGTGDETVLSHPDLRFENATYTFSREGSTPILVTADTLEIFKEKHTAIMDNPHFLQYDENQELNIEAHANGCSIDTSDYEITLTGQVQLSVPNNDLFITAENLHWNDTDKTLESDGEVTIQYENGNRITGTGFFGNMSTRHMEFQSITKGEVNET